MWSPTAIPIRVFGELNYVEVPVEKFVVGGLFIFALICGCVMIVGGMFPFATDNVAAVLVIVVPHASVTSA